VTAGPQAAAPLRVGGVPEHFNLPWHLAAERRRFTDAGMDVRWIDQPEGTGQMVASLAHGSIDAIVALTEGVVAAVARGLEARIVGCYTDSPLQWGVHVASGSPVRNIAGLHGRRVAVSRPGSGSHLMAAVLAAQQGWGWDPDLIVPVGGIDALRAALAQGAADWFLWDRFMTSPYVETGELRRVGVVPTPWPAFVVAAPDSLDRSRRADLRHALAIAVREGRVLRADPDGPALVAERYGLAPDQALEWHASTTFDDRSIGAEELDAVRAALTDAAILDP
jgi:ABC-type nitrate/sulfonate/bicarbonate transport system substrate-binding protein